MTGTAFEDELSLRLKGARTVAVVGIGDELQLHDRLGMVAARRIRRLGVPGVSVFLAGCVPEAFTGPIRRLRPAHVLLLDAADMGAAPGTVAIIGPERVAGARFSTHALPLAVVLEYLESTLAIPVTLVGIQPDALARGPRPTPAEEEGLKRVVHSIGKAASKGGHRPKRKGRTGLMS